MLKKDVNIMIELLQADITTLQVDAIVNAANQLLLGGSGVDGSIHRAAGPELLAACRKLNGCPTGEAKITPGFRLPAKYVIHAVGPVWSDGNHDEPELLRNAYRNALLLAAAHDVQSIAFPNISTGVYKFPKQLAAQIAIEAVKAFTSVNHSPERVIFVCYDSENYEIYKRLLNV